LSPDRQKKEQEPGHVAGFDGPSASTKMAKKRPEPFRDQIQILRIGIAVLYCQQECLVEF
jgi:hypothetical protein